MDVSSCGGGALQTLRSAIVASLLNDNKNTAATRHKKTSRVKI